LRTGVIAVKVGMAVMTAPDRARRHHG
jgi:hypothetical protein